MLAAVSWSAVERGQQSAHSTVGRPPPMPITITRPATHADLQRLRLDDPQFLSCVEDLLEGSCSLDDDQLVFEPDDGPEWLWCLVREVKGVGVPTQQVWVHYPAEAAPHDALYYKRAEYRDPAAVPVRVQMVPMVEVAGTVAKPPREPRQIIEKTSIDESNDTRTFVDAKYVIRVTGVAKSTAFQLLHEALGGRAAGQKGKMLRVPKSVVDEFLKSRFEGASTQLEAPTIALPSPTPKASRRQLGPFGKSRASTQHPPIPGRKRPTRRSSP